MATRANSIGLPNQLITNSSSSGHVSYFFGSNTVQWLDTVTIVFEKTAVFYEYESPGNCICLRHLFLAKPSKFPKKY